MARRRAVDRDVLALWMRTALTRPAREGARIVALHWLMQLLDARAAWATAMAGELSKDRRAEAEAQLHRARVAVRRLRSTLREYSEALDLSVGKRTTKALAKFGRATNRVRDRDVHVAWLRAALESGSTSTLPGEAREEGEALLAAFSARRSGGRRRIARAFERHVDRARSRLTERLLHYDVAHDVGVAESTGPFALALADRLEHGAAHLRRDLACATDVHALDALHRVRLRLKHQRALLAPFADATPALQAWFALATGGQDLLGAMRDASLLERQARSRGLNALADALEAITRQQFAEFHDRWVSDADSILDTKDAAVRALQQIADDAITPPLSSSHAASRGSANHGAATMPSIPDDHGLPMEIERKFLLHGLPPVAAMAPADLIEQGWLPGTLLRERLRRTLGANGIERLTRTIKLGRPGSRIEVEEPTDSTLFNALWPLTVNARIRKRRHIVTEDGLRWEIDVFLDRDLVLAEIELDDEAQAIELPAWLTPFVVKEVTHDPAYLNSVMARRDVPAPERLVQSPRSSGGPSDPTAR